MPPFRCSHRTAPKTALTMNVTGMVFWTIITSVMCSKVRVSVSITQENTVDTESI